MTPERKRLYTIILLTVFCLIIVTELGNFRAKQLGIDLTDNQVKLALNHVVDGLDRERLQEVIDTLDEHDPYYIELRQAVITAKADYGLEDIYLLSKHKQQNKWLYIVDARMNDDPKRVSLGEADKHLFGALENIMRGKIVEKEYYRTAEGTVVTNYQGVKDDQGNIIAVVGGDYAAKEMADFLYLTRYVQIGIIFLTLLLIGGSVLLSRRTDHL